jgi:ABC-type tungstate transport system permease subunit
LLNPAHALLGAYGTNKAMATAFVDWLIDADGGQKTVRDFAVNGEVLYTVAPSGVDPLAGARDIV